MARQPPPWELNVPARSRGLMAQLEAQRKLKPMSERRIERREKLLQWVPGRPLEILDELQQLLARREMDRINNFVRKGRYNEGIKDLICNEIIGQLERNPEDKELFQLAESLYGTVFKFKGDDEFAFEPSRDVSIIIRAKR